MLYFRQLRTVSAPTIRTKGKIEYYADFATFDTEWTNIKDGETGVGLLYVWQFCIFGETYYGRTMDDFKSFCLNLGAMLKLNNKKRLVIYVHNLAADFQFLQGYFNFSEVMAVAKRAVLKARTPEGLEFRCSYKLSNMSLKKFLEQQAVEHQKKPDYDYDGIRTPDSILTDEEMEYAENDVLGLYEAVKAKMAGENDDITTIPMTATGYVRRHMREMCNADKFYRKRLHEQDLTEAQYKGLLDAFRGGNTHANRAHVGKVLDGIRSYDKTSDYPSACVYEDFPMGKFFMTDDPIKAVEDGYAVFMKIAFLDLETDDPIPYLSISKCKTDIDLIKLRPDIHKQALKVDNGRILRAKGWTVTTITDVDYSIIKEHYRYKECRVIWGYKCVKKKLPLPIRKAISEFFVAKTELKGVDGQEYFYMKSKNMLNSTYGMMVMASVRDVIELDDGEWTVKQPEDVKEELERYYKRRSTFLAYQWGVWVTAYARMYLQELIDICGDKIAYCDTDSGKFFDCQEIREKISEINKRIRKQAEESEVQAIAYTKDGKEQVLGSWDDEGLYEAFKTYGAKKYATVKKGKFSFTVSGLGKAAEEEIKNMGDFVLGRTIINSGRTISCYDDMIEPHWIEVEGVKYEIRSNMAILDTTYTLGVTDEYLDLVKELGRTYERVVIDGKKKLKFKSSIGYDPE